MRVITGTARGRKLKEPVGMDTRPTTDRLREAMFSRLGPYFEGGRVLDLFAGSGAIALEALSRGFDEAVLVDSSREACRIVRENIASLQVQAWSRVYQSDYKTALEKLEGQFDLIFLDPPYAFDRMEELIRTIGEKDLLKDDGVLAVETNARTELSPIEPFYIEKDAVYGISRITYMRKEKSQ